MKKGIGIMIVLMLLLTSCSLLGKADPTEDPAIAAIQGTLAVEQAAAEILAQTQAPIPLTGSTEEVAPPEVAATDETVKTDEPDLRVSANINVNCRMGPAANFPLVVSLKAGETAIVIGKNTDNGPYWKVMLENGKECWLTGDAVSLSGSADAVAMIVSPATPTPIPPPSWNGNWTILFSDYPNSPEDSASVIQISMTQTNNTLYSTFKSGAANQTIVINATVSADGMIVDGKLSYNGIPYVLRMVRNPDNVKQFRGKFYSASNPGFDGAICGGTQGSSYPSPCRP